MSVYRVFESVTGTGLEQIGVVTWEGDSLSSTTDDEAVVDIISRANEASTFDTGPPPAEVDAPVGEQRKPRDEEETVAYARQLLLEQGYGFAAESDLQKATLANRYQEGDVVETPESGVGVIAGAVAEDQTAPDDSDLPDIEASPDSPTYVVVTEDESQGMSLLKASDLEQTEIAAEVDALDTTKEAAAMAELAPDGSDSEIAELDFTMPESWRESDTPARVIALKAFAGMGGSFDGCVREMRGAVSNPDAFCGSFLDEVLGYESWRGDSPLPGD